MLLMLVMRELDRLELNERGIASEVACSTAYSGLWVRW